MKKKMITLLIAGVMTISMISGCGKETVTEQSTPAPTVEALPTEEASLPENNGETKVQLGRYIGITLEEVDPSIVEEEFMGYVAEHAELEERVRAAELGDVVNINYVGTMNGEPFEGGTDDSEEGFDLELGAGSFIEGFEEGLVGALPGEVRELNLTFPEDYYEELAGKPVVFTVTVNKVYEIVMPEVNDAFVARTFGYATVEEAKEALQELKNKESFAEQAKNIILETSSVENLPADKVEEMQQEVITEYSSYAEYWGRLYDMNAEEFMKEYLGFESMAALEDYAEEYAKEAITQELIMNEIAVKENLLLTEELYQELAAAYAFDFGYNDVESFEAAYSKEVVRETIQTDYILEYIFAKANVVRKK